MEFDLGQLRKLFVFNEKNQFTKPRNALLLNSYFNGIR